MEAKVKLLALLEKSGAKLVRNHRHQIYKLPNGLSITIPRDADTQTRVWENVYSRVRRRLEGYAEKRQGSEERERIPYKPTIEHRQEFLAGLPEREQRPPTPISPSPKGRPLPRAFDYNPNTPEPVPYVTSGPRVAHVARPVHSAGKIKMVQRPGGHSGECKTFSKEVLAEANRILMTEGEEAKNKYLDCIRSGQEYHHIPRQEMEMPIESIPMSGGSSIEETLNRSKQQLQKFRAQQEQIKLEIIRCEKTIEALELAHRLSTASLADLKSMAPSAPETNGNGYQTIRGKNIRWKEVIKEIIMTSPEPLKRKQLQDEMHRIYPDSTSGSIYQATNQAMNAGWLQEKGDEKGYFMRVVIGNL